MSGQKTGARRQADERCCAEGRGGERFAAEQLPADEPNGPLTAGSGDDDAVSSSAHTGAAAQGSFAADSLLPQNRMRRIGLFDFVVDRVPVLAFFAGAAAAAMLTVHFGFRQRGVRLPAADILYLLLLFAAFAVAYLVFDYVRMRDFYQGLNRLDEGRAGKQGGGEPGLDGLIQIQEPVTREQRALQRIVRSVHGRYEDELSHYRERAELQRDFTDRWVHGMKTPVAVIDLLTQLPRDADPAEERERLASIREEKERLAEGLELMLHAARLERFEWDVRPRRTELAGLLRAVINEHKQHWIRSGLIPRMETAGEVFAETDAKWMAFIFQQLLSNALKYTLAAGPGRGAPRIRLLALQDGASVEIADEGVGIPPQDLPLVFRPFFTGENGRSMTASTGMGLYLAKQVCDRLGHSLTLQSVEGKGTTAVVRFIDESLTGAARREDVR